MKWYLSKFRPAGRLDYASMCGMLAVLVFTNFLNTIRTSSAPPGDPWFWVPLTGVMCILAAVGLVLQSFRRLLDLGEDPRRAWLALVPLYNLYFIGRLIIKPGVLPHPEHGGGGLRPAPPACAYWIGS